MNNEIKRLGGEGILNDKDIREFSDAQQAIIDFMSDGEWYSATSIIEWSGQREGLRRLRDLRSRGFEVEKMRIKGSRDFFYRLTKVNPPTNQMELPL
jgi:hypothetical protein